MTSPAPAATLAAAPPPAPPQEPSFPQDLADMHLEDFFGPTDPPLRDRRPQGMP